MQCLLLASKFNEVARVYPAQIVHQIPDWGESEFQILKNGQIEEYILNILDFDLMFLTPIDFLEFYLEIYQVHMPKCCT